MFQILTCLTAKHDWRLVALAVAICFLASIVAISLFHRAQAAAKRDRFIWLSLDAAAAGYGIWATHFILILAYDPTFVMGYSLPLTIISLLLAILITGAGLLLALRDIGRWSAAFGGAVIGLGISVMHFTGMSALDFPGHVTWSLGLVAAAISLGVGFGALSLIVAVRVSDWRNMLGAAALFTLAIISTHFTAMSAMRFVLDPMRVLDQASLLADSQAALITGVAATILGACLVAALSDRQSKDQLRQQKFLLDTTLENLSQGVCMYDAAGCVTIFNERYTKMTGCSKASLKGRSLLELLRQRKRNGEFTDDPETYFANILVNIKEGKSSTTIIDVASGHSLRIVDHPVPSGGWVTTIEDITDWKAAQAKIAHMARHDALTNLPNRTLFRERLEYALSRATRNEQVAVHCIDLDHFKDVNDSLGHPIGDDLLKAVAQRLRDCVRESDTVARLGGDEFAIVQGAHDSKTSGALSLATRLVESIGMPYELEGHQVIIGASIGVSVAPNDSRDPDQLLKNADIALYLAKEDGRGAFRFFEVGMDARAQARWLLLIDLRAALLRNEFEVYYQPIYDLEANRIVCFEALIRWNHPLRGMVEPLSFIPIAEETGLIVPIGDWVLRRACLDATGWPQDVSVAVNLSPAQFKNRDLVSSIREALNASRLAPNRLELEITESVLLQDSKVTLVVLHQLREFGICISMDDFGTGYSSLSYLRSFPFDKIKIDRLFVRELASHADSIAIVRAVTGLGKSLGIATIAEGVETKEQLAILRAEGCTEAQGFLFNKPRPAADVEKMLSDKRLSDVA